MSSADAAAPEAAGPVTIGVAISIPRPFGAELAAWRRSIGDPVADAVPPHITLLPPTEVDEAGHKAVAKHLAMIADEHQPFRVHLRGTGTFRPVSPVVFVALARGISHCELLAGALRCGPLPVELHFPYHPHVTVAQALPDPVMDEAYAALADYEADFLVDTFGLYRHGTDGVWRRERTFPLGDGATPVDAAGS